MTAGSNGVATITTPSLTPGYHTLYARAFDAAHNVSAQTAAAYVFYIAPVITTGATYRHEAESLQPVSDGTPAPRTTSCASGCPSYLEGPNGRWSGNTELHLAAQGPASWATPSFTTTTEADYAINVQLTTCDHFGVLQISLDGHVLKQTNGSTAIDTYSANVGTENIALGGLHLAAGTHHLTYSLIAADPAVNGFTYAGSYGSPAVGVNFNDHGYSAGIDYIRVQPINNVTAASLNAAINNNGITATGDPAGDLGPTTGHRTLSADSLAGDGFGPGATKTVTLNDAKSATSTHAAVPASTTTFVMPSYNANGTDNVIAMRQTIPFTIPAAQASTAHWIDLLATSSCGPGGTPADDSGELTVNYRADPSGTSPAPIVAHDISRVPDFTDTVKPPGETSSTSSFTSQVAANLTSRLGTAAPTSTGEVLSVISVPLSPELAASRITSLVLPYLGSDLSESCRSANLHVFAISSH